MGGICCARSLPDDALVIEAPFSKNQFELVCTLGRGAFGEVWAGKLLNESERRELKSVKIKSKGGNKVAPAPVNANLSDATAKSDDDGQTRKSDEKKYPRWTAIKRISKRKVLVRGDKNGYGACLSFKSQAAAKAKARHNAGTSKKRGGFDGPLAPEKDKAADGEEWQKQWDKIIAKSIAPGKTWRLSKSVWIERDTLCKVNSAYTINCFCAFQDENYLYMVMPLASGDLRDMMKKTGPMPEPKVRIYAAQILLALEHIHSMKMVYRDLKPRNVLIDESGRALLSDYGLCKVLPPESGYLIKGRAGTRGFIAPEVVRGSKYDYSCDYFSFGTFIYVLLTNRIPWGKSGQNFHEGLRYETHNPRDPYTGERPKPKKLSPAAKDLIRRLTAIAVKHRLGCVVRARDMDRRQRLAARAAKRNRRRMQAHKTKEMVMSLSGRMKHEVLQSYRSKRSKKRGENMFGSVKGKSKNGNYDFSGLTKTYTRGSANPSSSGNLFNSDFMASLKRQSGNRKAKKRKKKRKSEVQRKSSKFSEMRASISQAKILSKSFQEPIPEEEEAGYEKGDRLHFDSGEIKIETNADSKNPEDIELNNLNALTPVPPPPIPPNPMSPPRRDDAKRRSRSKIGVSYHNARSFTRFNSDRDDSDSQSEGNDDSRSSFSSSDRSSDEDFSDDTPSTFSEDTSLDNITTGDFMESSSEEDSNLLELETEIPPQGGPALGDDRFLSELDGWAAVKRHPWFFDIDWKAMERAIHPPAYEALPVDYDSFEERGKEAQASKRQGKDKSKDAADQCCTCFDTSAGEEREDESTPIAEGGISTMTPEIQNLFKGFDYE